MDGERIMYQCRDSFLFEVIHEFISLFTFYDKQMECVRGVQSHLRQNNLCDIFQSGYIFLRYLIPFLDILVYMIQLHLQYRGLQLIQT